MLLAAVTLVAACASLPERADQSAHAFGYQKLELPGAGFQHVAYFKPGTPATTLHVYVEHDGVPWVSSTRPAADPTPRRLVMLELMAGDPAPALYLGRPCYFGMAQSPRCEAIWWTHRRFSPEVIQSMQAALAGFLRSRDSYRSIELFGYSGGGVVATLMARDFPSTRRLVTIAAPLDLEGWIRIHNYSQMTGSIDPLLEVPLPETVTQLHLAGSDDAVVPGYLISPFVARQPGAQFLEVGGADHYCCWKDVWSRIVLAH